jgi:NTP pyrophosphatase (non-canonical NTP hydrolase)
MTETSKLGLVKSPVIAACLAINILQDEIHQRNVAAGWWHEVQGAAGPYPNVQTKVDLRTNKYVHFTKLALVHAEVSEALEGLRKGCMDDHLPTRPMVEVELADAIIRILDLAGALNLDVGGAIVEKLDYNSKRADHKPENRAKEGGKSV